MSGRAPDRPTVPEVWPMVRWYQELPSRLCANGQSNLAGGSLHIVLDDYNVKDGDVRYCMESAAKNGDVAGFFLAWTLLTMSLTQRRKLCRTMYNRIGP